MRAASGSPSGSSRSIRRCARIPREQMKAAAKEEAFMLRFDQERALAALPLMLPTEEERREAVDIVRRIGYADGEITPESEAVLAKIERDPGPRPARRQRRRAPDSSAAATPAMRRTGAAATMMKKEQDPADDRAAAASRRASIGSIRR